MNISKAKRNKVKRMSRPKNETVAKYHKEHFKRYTLNLRNDDDAALLEYIESSEIPVSELFRQAFIHYMRGNDQ